MMNVLETVVTPIALSMTLANMKMLSAMIMMNVLMTHAALYKDVFTLITHINVSLPTGVMMPIVIKIKDVLSLIPLTVVMMMTNVMNMIVMKM
jgi:hypothetical protein